MIRNFVPGRLNALVDTWAGPVLADPAILPVRTVVFICGCCLHQWCQNDSPAEVYGLGPYVVLRGWCAKLPQPAMVHGLGPYHFNHSLSAGMPPL